MIEHREVCISLVKIVKTLKLELGDSLEKRWELEEMTPSLCGFLNNVDIVGKAFVARLNLGVNIVSCLLLCFELISLI